MTYSLSLYGWDDCVKFDVDECATDDGAYSESNGSAGIPALLAASGTVFGDIVVWGVVDDQGKSQRAANEQLTSIVKRWLSDAYLVNAETLLHLHQMIEQLDCGC